MAADGLKISLKKAGIIGAEQHEIDLFLDKIDSAETFEYAGMVFHEGRLFGVPVVVARCGVGKVNAAMCVQILATRFSVSCVVNTGSAGGVDDRLSVLDMVASTDAVFHDVDVRTFGYAPGQIPGTPSPFFEASSVLRNAAEKAFAKLDADFFRALEGASFSFPENPKNAGSSAVNPGAKPDADSGAVSVEARPEKRFPVMREGRIASGDVFVADKDLRQKIVAVFSPSCVEMEGAAIAQACVANGLPFLILRSVSDMAGDDAGLPHREFAIRASVISAAVVCGMLECAADWIEHPA